MTEMATNISVINGDEYNFSTTSLILFGREVEGIQEFNYTRRRGKNNIIGRGGKVVARTRGNYEYEGSISIHAKEYRAILASIPEGMSLVDLPPFNLPITFDNGERVYTDMLEYVEFTEEPMTTSAGDENILYVLPLIIGEIRKGR